MRWILVLMLVHGLAPDLAEAAEVVVHVVVAGHAPHTATDPCDDERGSEHGCGTARHQCSCCPNQAMAPHRERAAIVCPDAGSGEVVAVRTVRAGGEPSRPFRPPIG